MRIELKVSGVCKKGEGDFLLKDISFSQRKLQRIAIAGETGAGKSTLLKIIAGLIQPDAGEVLFENKNVIGPDDIGEKLKITCMLVSHDPLDILSWADKMLVMKDGKIVQKGKPEIIYRQPVNEYVGGLFGKYNLIPPGRFKAFSKLPGIKRNIPAVGKKSMFTRPENFKLVSKRNKALREKFPFQKMSSW